MRRAAYDPNTPIEETMDALLKLQREGKILHFGVSNYSADQIARARELGPVRAVELEYSFLKRDAEASVLRACTAAGVAALAYGVLGYGLLSGKYGEGARFGAGDRRGRLPGFRGEAYREALRAAGALRAVAGSLGCTPAQAAIGWVLGGGLVDFAVVGAKDPSQIEQAAAAAELDGGAIRDRLRRT